MMGILINNIIWIDKHGPIQNYLISLIISFTNME